MLINLISVCKLGQPPMSKMLSARQARDYTQLQDSAFHVIRKGTMGGRVCDTFLRPGRGRFMNVPIFVMRPVEHVNVACDAEHVPSEFAKKCMAAMAICSSGWCCDILCWFKWNDFQNRADYGWLFFGAWQTHMNLWHIMKYPPIKTRHGILTTYRWFPGVHPSISIAIWVRISTGQRSQWILTWTLGSQRWFYPGFCGAVSHPRFCIWRLL